MKHARVLRFVLVLPGIDDWACSKPCELRMQLAIQSLDNLLVICCYLLQIIPVNELHQMLGPRFLCLQQFLLRVHAGELVKLPLLQYEMAWNQEVLVTQ